MKYFVLLLLVLTISLTGNKASAQCTPDPGCMELLNPGEMCPEILADGTVGVPYSQVVTIIPPATADLGSGSVNIYKIRIDSVKNLPPGLTYQTNAAEFLVTSPLTRYCVLLSGTPTTAGTYDLIVYVKPFINIAGFPVGAPQQVDDTSLTVTVNTSTWFQPQMNQGFSLIPSKPNPFNGTTKIGFVSPGNDGAELKVYDVVGNIIYSESIESSRGENYFSFDGLKLAKGMYFYSVSNGKEVFTKQMIKN